jgi:hypothetical protein
MNVRYSLGDYTLKVLGCDKSLDVLDFYYRNRNDFDIYESDKPEAFYTEEFIKNMLNAENKALMSLHFVRFFLVSNDNPDYIIGTISLSHINRGSSPSANMGYKIDRLNQIFTDKELTLELEEQPDRVYRARFSKMSTPTSFVRNADITFEFEVFDGIANAKHGRTFNFTKNAQGIMEATISSPPAVRNQFSGEMLGPVIR